MDLLVLAQHGSNKEARAALMLGSQRYDAGLQEKVDILLMAIRNPVNSPVEVGSFSHYLQGFEKIPGWCRISEPSTVVVAITAIVLFITCTLFVSRKP